MGRSIIKHPAIQPIFKTEKKLQTWHKRVSFTNHARDSAWRRGRKAHRPACPKTRRAEVRVRRLCGRAPLETGTVAVRPVLAGTIVTRAEPVGAVRPEAGPVAGRSRTVTARPVAVA